MFFFLLSSLCVLILLDHFLRSFLLVFFLNHHESIDVSAREKLARIRTRTRIRESTNRQVHRAFYSTAVLARNPGFNVSLMNLSLLPRHVTTTIVSPEEVSCSLLAFSPLLFCHLPISPTQFRSPNYFIAH